MPCCWSRAVYSLPSKHGDVGVSKAVFLGTTNNPYNINAPVRDRFDCKLFVPLPDDHERYRESVHCTVCCSCWNIVDW